MGAYREGRTDFRAIGDWYVAYGVDKIQAAKDKISF